MGDDARIIPAQQTIPHGEAVTLARGAFFNQAAPGRSPAKTALMGPTLDGLLLSSEYFTMERGYDVERDPDPIQRLFLPLAPHQLKNYRDYRQTYNGFDSFDSLDCRVAIEYRAIGKDEGVVLVAASDKGAKIVFRKQFVLDFRKRTDSGFPLQAEEPSRGWALLA